jgi:hypothetical protein
VKFHLLVAASALVVGLGVNGAFAGDDHHGNDGNNGHDPSTTAVGVAVALSNQDGGVALNFAKGTVGTNTIGAVGGTGLVNIQQNNGANSILQDQNTLGAILNCSCSTSDQVLSASLAASNQSALVLGNVSIGASNKTASGTSAATWNNVKNGSASTNGTIAIGTSAASDDEDAHASATTGNSSTSVNNNRSGSKSHTWSFASTAVGSSNSLSSFSGTGLYNISQNNGNNSMLQSGNTVAAIVGR